MSIAISSISKNSVISNKEDVKAFAEALEKAANCDMPLLPALGK